jgi:RNA polymerase sigma-70 factor (ECF subfamily)
MEGTAKAKGEITQLLEALRAGDASDYERFYESVYAELRRVAAYLMSRERAGHTLQPTALVNEAFLRLVGEDHRWENRAHFFGAAARAMRRVLVDYARKKVADKRGGGAARVTFAELAVAVEDPNVDLLALDEALTALMSHDKRLGQVVELRYFAGCTNADIAEILGQSEPTVKRDWAFARAWLLERLTANSKGNPPESG